MINLKYLLPLLLVFLELLLVFSCHTKKALSKNETENTSGIVPNVKVGEHERGVHFRRFANGVDTSKVYMPGEYFIPSFDRFIIYNIESKTGEEIIEIASKNESIIYVRVKYTCKPIPEKIAHLHYFIGKDYNKYGVKPKLEVAIKAYFKNYLAEEISIADKMKYEREIFKVAKEKIAKKYIELESIQIIEFATDEEELETE